MFVSSLSNIGGIDGTLHISSLFVANANVNAGKLKVNVNHFDNDNVWYAGDRHRLVVKQQTIWTQYFGLWPFATLTLGRFARPRVFLYTKNAANNISTVTALEVCV